MTNGEKFKTAEERGKMFNAYCHSQLCDDCELNKFNERQESSCYFHWLDLEHKEELKNCPFCGGKAGVVSGIHEGCEYHWVECSECYGRSIGTSLADRTIAAWNRRV
jgi:Lar family restriction alleviation protein